jgi:hypothetical protein
MGNIDALLLQPLLNIFTSDTVKGLSAAEIQGIFGPDENAIAEKKRINARLTALSIVLQELIAFQEEILQGNFTLEPSRDMRLTW